MIGAIAPTTSPIILKAEPIPEISAGARSLKASPIAAPIELKPLLKPSIPACISGPSIAVIGFSPPPNISPLKTLRNALVTCDVRMIRFLIPPLISRNPLTGICRRMPRTSTDSPTSLNSSFRSFRILTNPSIPIEIRFLPIPASPSPNTLKSALLLNSVKLSLIFCNGANSFSSDAICPMATANTPVTVPAAPSRDKP